MSETSSPRVSRAVRGRTGRPGVRGRTSIARTGCRFPDLVRDPLLVAAVLVEADCAVPVCVRESDPGFVGGAREGCSAPGGIACGFGAVQELRDERRVGFRDTVVRALLVGDGLPHPPVLASVRTGHTLACGPRWGRSPTQLNGRGGRGDFVRGSPGDCTTNAVL